MDSNKDATDGKEEGSATVWYVGVIAGLMVLGVLLLVLVAVWSARAAAQAGADMAALGGADISSVAVFEVRGSSTLACAQAGSIAEANAVALSQCWTEGGDTLVIVTKDVSIGLWTFQVHAKARAGPT